MRQRRPLRRAFTLLEMLVVIGIIGILIGLLLAAIHRVRGSASRIEASNNLRQIGLATLHCQGSIGYLPPGNGCFPGGPLDATLMGGTCGFGNPFFHLLPYLEQGNLYNRGAEAGNGPSENPGVLYTSMLPSVSWQPVKVYQNPADPSMSYTGRVSGSQTYVDGWGACGFAFNAQVFCQVDSKGQFMSWWNNTRIPDDIPDGASTTILFTEKLTVCGPPGQPNGGANAWAAAPGEQVTPVFALSRFPSFNPPPPGAIASTGPQSHFQAAPIPTKSSLCQYWVPESPRPEGILVGLADGSVRLVAVGVTSKTWWAACTAAGNETLGQDW